jgi:hypothetical protein
MTATWQVSAVCEAAPAPPHNLLDDLVQMNREVHSAFVDRQMLARAISTWQQRCRGDTICTFRNDQLARMSESQRIQPRSAALAPDIEAVGP